MKKILLLLFINFILALFQSSFFFEIFGSISAPNLILAFSISLIALNRTNTSLQSAFVGGLLLDLFTFNVIGSSSVLIIALIYISLYIQNYLFRGLYISILSLFVSSILYNLFITFNFNQNVFQLIYGGILTCIFGLIFFYINKTYALTPKPDKFVY